jgi:endonuclease G, mitochondrial
MKSFRWLSNTLFLLLFFVVIGLVLHHKGHTKPLVAFWDNLKSLFRPANSPQQNPYKAPEPDVASEDRTQADNRISSEASADNSGTLLEKEGIEPKEKVENTAKASGTTATTGDFTKIKGFYLPAIGSNDQIVRHNRYTLRYREQYEQADWVAYELLGDEARAHLGREGQQFIPDPEVKTGSATTSDYTRSGYDRGHLCPAGDFNIDIQDKTETFYMSNISPQVPDFNRGIWSDLEQKFRDWAQRDEMLYVVTGPVLKPGLKTIGRANEIAIPEMYYKIALCLTDKQPRMIGFLLNNEFSNESLKSFVVSVDEIEKLTGIDFFNRLPDALERKLESQSKVSDWFAGMGKY